MAQGHLCRHMLEAGAVGEAASRDPRVVQNGDGLRPAEGDRFVAETLWRRVLSVWLRTCSRLDWRTYTMAARFTWSAVILSLSITPSHRSRGVDVDRRAQQEFGQRAGQLPLLGNGQGDLEVVPVPGWRR